MSCLFNKINLNKIKEIERKAYPSFMWQFQDLETPEDAKDEVDCDGEFFCHIDNGWYMLGCNGSSEVYIEDLASSRSLGFPELNTILRILKGFGNKVITADCRSSTSYKLLKLLEKKGSIEILEEEPWNWESEKMYELKFKTKPESFKEWLLMMEFLDPDTKGRLEKISPRNIPNRDELERLIKQMEDEPTLVSPRDAFTRLKAISIDAPKSATRVDPTIQKANSMLPNPGPVLLGLQKDYENKLISNPELLTLTYLKANGATDDQINNAAQEIKALSPNIRKDLIMFKDNKPSVKTPNGVVEIQDMLHFSTSLHSLSAQGVDFSKKLQFDPKTDVRPDRQRDLLIAKNGIYIYRGDSPASCRLYGRETPWCIASSSSTYHYFSYRHENKQTQYFIFDTNKDKDDPARMVNPGVADPDGYSEWVDLDNQPERDENGNGFRIKGYSSIDDYKKYLVNKLGVSMEHLDEMLKPTELTDAEIKLKDYIDRYKNALQGR